MGTKKNTDTVPAMLTPGEFVIKRDSAQKIGYDTLELMNETGKVPDIKKHGGKMGNKGYLQSKFLNGMVEGYQEGGVAQIAQKDANSSKFNIADLMKLLATEGQWMEEARKIDSLMRDDSGLYGGEVFNNEDSLLDRYLQKGTGNTSALELSPNATLSRGDATPVPFLPDSGELAVVDVEPTPKGMPVNIFDILERTGPDAETPSEFTGSTEAMMIEGLIDYIMSEDYDSKSGLRMGLKQKADTLKTFGNKSALFGK
jgi:hypothetical protein